MFFLKDHIRSRLSTVSIDFSKPWWKLIVDQKFLVGGVAGIFMISALFWSMVPLLIAYVLRSEDSLLYGALLFGWFCIEVARSYALDLNAQFQLRCIYSIYQNAHEQLLMVDPLYHSQRSSGAILGKIDRAARGYEDLLDRITFDIGPLIVSLTSTIVATGFYSFWLALSIGIIFVGMFFIGYYFSHDFINTREQEFIKSDDVFRSVAVENLAQIHLIRSSFASDYTIKKLAFSLNATMYSEEKLWTSYVRASLCLALFYLLALGVLLGVLLFLIKHGSASIPGAIGLVVAYIQNTQPILKIVGPLRKYIRSSAAIRDLWFFMPFFGKQSYPVVGTEIIIPEKTVLTLSADSLFFSYKSAPLFNEHSLELHVLRDTGETLLYGIIGPSGSGKTTLLSILGGQLKPVRGQVLVNGIDVYGVSDATRRQLIALQGQVPTAVRGTVKYNLLFGLPSNHGYTDDELMQVLQRVGLFEILSEQEGLSTMLGESGLNLSGGQKQRLNFAGLYLRAHYYHPALILIDEPTSSLDEISEGAITHMIQELARSAVTLIIAHRLKTVEQARGLIDLSLLAHEKKIIAYSPEELKERSWYYRQLIAGEISLT
jgi:ATP-binding cassette, subfamily B, bacterial